MSSSDEEFIPEDEEETGPALVKRLREKLKRAIEEKQEYLDGWQRSRADFANFKKEEAGREGQKESRATAKVLEELIPALDVLELSLQHHVSKELQLIQKQFLDALRRLGIERFGTIGDEYDPHLHEALAKHSDDHVITEVKRSGYKLQDTIIRPAQVLI